MIQDWSLITVQALQASWEEILFFLPQLLAALIIFILGWFIAIWIGKLVAGILSKLKFDSLFEKTGWKESLESADIKVSPSDFIGAICKWILVIVFLMILTEILGWIAFAGLLATIIAWIPNLIVAIIILVVAIIIADIIEKMIKASAKKMGITSVNFLGTVSKWAIYLFAGMAVLLQLGVTPKIVEIVIMGLVGTVTIALGLSFGLGGKEAAGKVIEDLRKKVSDKD